MNILLYIVAKLLSLVFVTIGIIYDIIKIFSSSHFGRSFKYINEKYKKLAIIVDEAGNAACPEFWNDILINKDSKYLFGNIGETISAVIGFNLMAGTLSRTGLFINNSLNFFWKKHTIKAANDYLTKTKATK